MRKVNLLAPEFDGSRDHESYRWRSAAIGKQIGAEKIGASLYELEEGTKSFPYHFHHGMEEWVIVLSGTPTLRGPDGERELRRGDVVCFPPGPGGRAPGHRSRDGADALGAASARDDRVPGQRQGGLEPTEEGLPHG